MPVYPTVSRGPLPQGRVQLILSSPHTFLRPRSLTDSSEIGTKPAQPALIKKKPALARRVFVRLYFVSLSSQTRVWCFF